MKALVEWKDGDHWHQAHVVVGCSRRENLWFKHEGNVYVMKDLKVGTEVVMQVSVGNWVHAGRVASGCIFLGEGQTYREMQDEQYKKKTLADNCADFRAELAEFQASMKEE